MREKICSEILHLAKEVILPHKQLKHKPSVGFFKYQEFNLSKYEKDLFKIQKRRKYLSLRGY